MLLLQIFKMNRVCFTKKPSALLFLLGHLCMCLPFSPHRYRLMHLSPIIDFWIPAQRAEAVRPSVARLSAQFVVVQWVNQFCSTKLGQRNLMWGNEAQLWFLSTVLFSHYTHTESYRAGITPSHLTQDKALCVLVCVCLCVYHCCIYVTRI